MPIAVAGFFNIAFDLLEAVDQPEANVSRKSVLEYQPIHSSSKPGFPISSKISLNALSGEWHKVRYAFTKGSQFSASAKRLQKRRGAPHKRFLPDAPRFELVPGSFYLEPDRFLL